MANLRDPNLIKACKQSPLKPLRLLLYWVYPHQS